MKYMLDTDSASYLLKGRAPGIEARLAGLPPSAICISVITRAELMYGLQRLPARHNLQSVVKQFLKVVRTLPWEAEAADWYAEIRDQLVSSGRPIGELDMMIAAHAISTAAVLITNNQRHFRRIKAPLRLENWMETTETL
jgi:tRNA(fMet)-specific endonuclease VapC